MTLTIIIAVYLIGCVLAYGRAYGCDHKRKNCVGIAFLSWIGFTIGVIAYFSIEGEEAFLAYRSPETILSKRTAKQLRQEEIQRRIKENTFDFSEQTPEMYSWMQ